MTNSKNKNNNNKVNVVKSTECTSIVVWGSIMGSNLSLKYISQLVRSMFQFTKFVRSVIIGIILSDGWLKKSGRQTNPKLGFEQSIVHFAYFWHVFNILKPYLSSWFSFRIKTSTFGKIGRAYTTFSLVLETRTLPCLIGLYNLFIVNNIKTIQVDLINYFDEVAFAHWIMGDGTRSPSGGLILCTDGFTIPEITRLINILIIKYDLKCGIHKNKNSYRLYISSKSMDKVRSLVESHIIPEMQYKISKK